MAKKKSAKQYEAELRKMIKARTGVECEPWLTPQIRTTAMNEVMLDKIQDELEDLSSLIVPVVGSQGQMKNEVSPLLPHYDKVQRTLLMQFEALGLNYAATPSKVTQDTKKGVDAERDGLMGRISEVQDAMNDVPEM